MDRAAVVAHEVRLGLDNRDDEVHVRLVETLAQQPSLTFQHLRDVRRQRTDVGLAVVIDAAKAPIQRLSRRRRLEHAEAVVRVIEFLLAGLHGPTSSDLGALLVVLSDLLAALGTDVRAEGARRYLSGIQGSGKAASLSRALLSSRRATGR